MDKITLTVAIIALLISIGVPTYNRTVGSVLEDELKDYYICSIDENIMEFKGGVSGTAYTGYPYIDSRAGYIRCGTTLNKGKWIGLKAYSEAIGMDPYFLLEEKKEEVKIDEDVPEPNIGKMWKCSHEGCIRVK